MSRLQVFEELSDTLLASSTAVELDPFVGRSHSFELVENIVHVAFDQQPRASVIDRPEALFENRRRSLVGITSADEILVRRGSESHRREHDREKCEAHPLELRVSQSSSIGSILSSDRTFV